MPAARCPSRGHAAQPAGVGAARHVRPYFWCCDGAKSSSNGVQGSSNGVQGSSNGVQGSSNGVQGSANGVQGSSNGVQGSANGVQGCANKGRRSVPIHQSRLDLHGAPPAIRQVHRAIRHGAYPGSLSGAAHQGSPSLISLGSSTSTASFHPCSFFSSCFCPLHHALFSSSSSGGNAST